MTKRSRKQKRLLPWKIVLDTSVIVSAIGWGGAAGEILSLWKAGQIQSLVSDEIVDEYLEVLGRWVSEASLRNWRTWFSYLAKVTHIHTYLRQLEVSRDTTDNKFVDVAVAGGARYVVTRDKDLLVVKEFRQVKFVNPQEFVIAFRSAME